MTAEKVIAECISVTNVRPSPKAGQTIGYADVQIGPVTILGFSIVKNRSGSGHFVGEPVRFGNTGKAFPLIHLDKSVEADVKKLVLDTALPILMEGGQI